MKRDVHTLAEQLLHKDYNALSTREQHVINRIAKGTHISRDVRIEHDEGLTLGQRMADRVAAFGGSWPFIAAFAVIMFLWVVFNTYILIRWNRTFDPYPFIFLNLVLSMLAAVQAPIIMMSQNRQATKDRIDAAHDYEVNLKAELEIMALHQKIDQLKREQWNALMTAQHEQTQMLLHLVEEIRTLKGEGRTRTGSWWNPLKK